MARKHGFFRPHLGRVYPYAAISTSAAGAFYSAASPLSGLDAGYPVGDPTNAAAGYPSARRTELVNAGCTDIRLFFDTVGLYEASDKAARTTIINGWSAEIGVFVTAGFRVIVCWCPSTNTGNALYRRLQVQQSSALFDSYKTFSGEIATILAAAYNRHEVAFEPFNEPERDTDVGVPAQDWPSVLAPALVNAVKAAAPQHRIFIQCGDQAWIGRITEFPTSMFASPNVSAAFHDYRHTIITHPTLLTGINRIPWPVTSYPGGYNALLADMERKVNESNLTAEQKTAAIASNTGELNYIFNTVPQDQARIIADWGVAGAWADSIGLARHRIVCTETGMMSHKGTLAHDLSARAAFITSMVAANAAVRFGGVIVHQALGDDNFNMFEYTNNGGFAWKTTLIPEMATAMGWTLPTRYGAELAGTVDSSASWTARNDATLSTEYMAMKLDGANAFKGASRLMDGTTALGKTYRAGLLVQRLQGTSPSLVVHMRYDYYVPTYGEVSPGAVGEFFIESQATDISVGVNIEANNNATVIAHIAQQTFKEKL